jgi:hypothetical protein
VPDRCVAVRKCRVTCGDLLEAVSEDIPLSIAVVHGLWAPGGPILNRPHGYQEADTVAVPDYKKGAVAATRSPVPAPATAADLGRRRIQRVTTCGVAGLALAGFAMSYEALHAPGQPPEAPSCSASRPPTGRRR